MSPNYSIPSISCNFAVRVASHQAGQETVHAVGKQAALDTGVGIWALDGQATDIARGLQSMAACGKLWCRHRRRLA